MACEHDCQTGQGDLFGATDPPMIALYETEETPKVEHPEGWGVVPQEGGAANVCVEGIGEPPAGWLSSMWSGGYDAPRT